MTEGISRSQIEIMVADKLNDKCMNCPVRERVMSLESSRSDQYDQINELKAGQVRVATLLEMLQKSVEGIKEAIATLTVSLGNVTTSARDREVAGYKTALGLTFALILALLGTYVFVN